MRRDSRNRKKKNILLCKTLATPAIMNHLAIIYNNMGMAIEYFKKQEKQILK